MVVTFDAAGGPTFLRGIFSFLFLMEDGSLLRGFILWYHFSLEQDLLITIQFMGVILVMVLWGRLLLRFWFVSWSGRAFNI